MYIYMHICMHVPLVLAQFWCSQLIRICLLCIWNIYPISVMNFVISVELEETVFHSFYLVIIGKSS